MYDRVLDNYIIIINNKNLENIEIYSLKDLETCISLNLKLPQIYESKDIKFNQFFVHRECQNCKTSLEKFLRNDLLDHKVHFFCLYSTFYASIDYENDVCNFGVIAPYTKDVISLEEDEHHNGHGHQHHKHDHDHSDKGMAEDMK